MKIDNNIKYDFDDILICPKPITTIKSRGDIDAYYETHKGIRFPVRLPIITAPMNTVVSLDNMENFTNNQLIVALPRTISHIYIYNKYIDNKFPDFTFVSYGIDDFIEASLNGMFVSNFVLLDVANGHMQLVYDLAKEFKERYPNKYLMVGNIANPETYEWYARGGFVDFVRIGIGNGNGCLTTKQTSIGYPKASLINECYQVKQTLGKELDDDWKRYNNPEYRILNIKKPNIRRDQLPMIVADGGMKNYSDIIKALGLGADYVMVGSIFNKALESSGDNYLYNIKINAKLAKSFYEWNLPVKKHFYGMSTKTAQKKMGKTNLKTSEGVERKWKVEYRLNQWVENFEHYLRSAMSYSNAKNLEEFIGKADFNLITENAFNRFNK